MGISGARTTGRGGLVARKGIEPLTVAFYYYNAVLYLLRYTSRAGSIAHRRANYITSSKKKTASSARGTKKPKAKPAASWPSA